MVESQYAGTISYHSDEALGGYFDSIANVTWNPDPSIILQSPTTAQENGWTYSYAAEGSIDVTFTQLDPGCTASPTHFTVPQADAKPAPDQEINFLVMDNAANPTRFGASGIVNVDTVITCVTQDGTYSYGAGVSIPWSIVGSAFGGTVNADGSLQGNHFIEGIGTYLYNFQRVKH